MVFRAYPEEFGKGSEPNYSKEVYTVDGLRNGKYIVSLNGGTHPRLIGTMSYRGLIRSIISKTKVANFCLLIALSPKVPGRLQPNYLEGLEMNWLTTPQLLMHTHKVSRLGVNVSKKLR